MSRIFLSHSSANNAEAVALRDWLEQEGWKDEVFLDLDPKRGIAAGERWERALNEAANRCEAVLFLVSKHWLGSHWCSKEFILARHLNKRLFGVLIEDLPIGDLPEDIAGTWQVVRLAAGRDHIMLRAVLPITHDEMHVTFSAEGLARLKHGLEEAGLGPKYFRWPPANDPNRPPYRGLRPLEAEDAGIFFGRDAPIVEALDALRGLREVGAPRLLVILGASGAGKSSFLRAGLLPRLARDDRHFLPLPIMRPGRAAISGETGLLHALELAFQTEGIMTTRAKLRSVIEGGPSMLRPMLQALVEKATPGALASDLTPKAPTLVLSIDQGEELFLAETQDEAQRFLAFLRDLLVQDAPEMIAVLAIRSNSYGQLQEAKSLECVRKVPFDLGPMPKGSYAEVIKGPARRLEGSARALEIEESLVDALLADVESGGAKDALPLLALTLERLYLEHGGDGDLTLAEYQTLGGFKGSIEAAVERALGEADSDPTLPKDRAERLALLRRGIIPWLAGIDPDTGAPRRRVAKVCEIPIEARPLLQQLVAHHLLATDVAKETGETTIEPAHEALLRQWSLLQGWLVEDAALLAVLDGIKRARRDWAANARSPAWLTHQTGRLDAAQRLTERPDLAANLEAPDREYLLACHKTGLAARRRSRHAQLAIYGMLVGIIAGLLGWINQGFVKEQVNWFVTMRPYMYAHVRPFVLAAAAEQTLTEGDTFKECAKDCPLMVVIPINEFTMGSPADEKGRYVNEGPQHGVRFAKPFAVAKFEVTFDEWDACVAVGGCEPVSDSGWGRGRRPVINVTWWEARQYVTWLSKMTNKAYRLLSEAEWEYAARGGMNTAYSWGEDIGAGKANCTGCGSKWDNKQTAPVGSFPANRFGLHDMHGNVWEWVEDCFQDSYDDAPRDGAAGNSGDCADRVIRGGSWSSNPNILRSANRSADTTLIRYSYLGFRVARTLDH